MDQSNRNEFLGRGWSFPPTFNKGSSTVEMVEGEADIKRSLEILFTTSLGERILHPDYGSNLFLAQFDIMGTSMQTDITEILESAIVKFEPRVEVEEVKLEATPDEGRAEIHLSYRIVQTNTIDNMVFPFYLNKG